MEGQAPESPLPNKTARPKELSALRETVTFRPAPALRWALGLAGFGSGCGALRCALGALFGEGAGALFLGSLLLAGAIAGYAVQARAVVAGPEGLASVHAFGARRVAWSDVLCLEQTRRSFIVETRKGPVSAGWIDPRSRDRLLRLVLQYAKLMATSEGLRFGLVARYIPRQRPIAFGAPEAGKERTSESQ